jgi:hypothetical protein
MRSSEAWDGRNRAPGPGKTLDFQTGPRTGRATKNPPHIHELWGAAAQTPRLILGGSRPTPPTNARGWEAAAPDRGVRWAGAPQKKSGVWWTAAPQSSVHGKIPGSYWARYSAEKHHDSGTRGFRSGSPGASPCPGPRAAPSARLPGVFWASSGVVAQNLGRGMGWWVVFVLVVRRPGQDSLSVAILARF